MKAYLFSHFWESGLLPQLKDIPFGMWAEYKDGENFWRIMTTKTKAPLAIIGEMRTHYPDGTYDSRYQRGGDLS